MQKYLYADLYNLEETHWWHRTKRNLVSYFLKQNLSDNRSKILDVGCGTGKNLEVFSKFGNVWGIDNSNEAIIFCKRRGLKKVVKGNIEKMPFKKNSFNAITALDVLEHVNDSKALIEINRVLKKGGILIITVPAFSWLWSKWDEILFHKRRYTDKSLRKVLQENGFKVNKISYSYSFLVLPALIIRGIKKMFYRHYYPSDFQLSNKTVNHLLGTIANIEKIFIINYNISFGTSLIAVAKKISQ